jgi:hypothetical protein
MRVCPWIRVGFELGIWVCLWTEAGLRAVTGHGCILASCDLYASWIGYDNIIFNAITSANAFDIDPKFMKFTTPA